MGAPIAGSEPLIPDGDLVLAATQTGGRGRMGRKWSSPQGGLYFSLILRPNLDLQRASLLSLVLAVSCARSLQNYINYPCRVKWPNDVMIDGLKAGGILLEASGEMDRLAYVVAGIGLNVNQTLLDLPVEVRGLATSLIAVTGQNCDLNLLAAHLLKDLQQDYYSFLQEGFAPFLEAYKQFCIHLQQPISVNNGKDQIIGINKDIDENGNLLIEADGKLWSISTGDVQLIDFQGNNNVLKAQELKGFKSFATIPRSCWQPGINIIVGPNGCGKEQCDRCHSLGHGRSQCSYY